MKFYDSTSREVDILETDGGYEEAYVSSAVYLDDESDDGAAVPDDELDYLTETYFEEISHRELMKQVDAAEAYYEGDR